VVIITSKKTQKWVFDR